MKTICILTLALLGSINAWSQSLEPSSDRMQRRSTIRDTRAPGTALLMHPGPPSVRDYTKPMVSNTLSYATATVNPSLVLMNAQSVGSAPMAPVRFSNPVSNTLTGIIISPGSTVLPGSLPGFVPPTSTPPNPSVIIPGLPITVPTLPSIVDPVLPVVKPIINPLLPIIAPILPNNPTRPVTPPVILPKLPLLPPFK